METKQKTATHTAFVRSDVNNHNGALDYYVVLELMTGRRYALQTTVNCPERLKKAAQTITETKLSEINIEEHWSEIDPAYGSQRHAEIGDFHLMDEEEFNYGREQGYW